MSSFEKLSKMKTFIRELPLIYERKYTNEKVTISWKLNRDQKIEKGKYIFVFEKNEKKRDKGTLHGLSKVSEFRNDLIRNGWKLKVRPNIKINNGNGIHGKIQTQTMIEKMLKLKV